MGLPVLAPWAPVLVLARYPATVPCGGVKLIVALLLAVLTTAKFVGGLGKKLVVIELDAVELAELPCPLVAVIVNVYEVVADKPVTMIGFDAPDTTIFPGKLVIV